MLLGMRRCVMECFDSKRVMYIYMLTHHTYASSDVCLAECRERYLLTWPIALAMNMSPAYWWLPALIVRWP